ncbi:MAG: DAK2 domain-containing protein [Lachnospiraceae bacterium]|nr:DAK2 domain-containing protein [Lachnospiraceae bacterium]
MTSEFLVKMLGEISAIMQENKEKLIALDSVVGDGDLGLTMTKGFAVAYETAGNGETDAGRMLYNAGKAMSGAAPSTMGTLMALGLMGAGKVLKGKTELVDADLVEFAAAYLDAVMTRGKAKLGEKTFLDGFHPGVEALKAALAAGESLAEATAKAAVAAEEGFKAAKGMLAVHGKPAVKGEASREMDDPGACVAMLIWQAIAKAAA